MVISVPRDFRADLTTGDVIALNGDAIPVDVSGASPTADGASVVTADLRTINGIIHVIDYVMLPPAP